MIFLRAFPFSFSIFWRYIIALPALIIALFMLGFLALVAAFLASMISPVFALIIAVAFGLGAGVIPVMVGLRVGLQANYVKPRNNYLGMMKPAIGYGFFEAVVILIIGAACAGIYLLATPLALTDLVAADTTELEALLAEFGTVGPTLEWGLIGAAGFLAFAVRAALLVPLAGAAVGSDPDGRPHTPFYGFGDGFVSVFALVLISQVGLIAAGPISISVLDALGIYDGAMMQIWMVASFTEDLSGLSLLRREAFILIGTIVLISLFFFSLQCAGAVLVYLRQRKLVGARQRAIDEILREDEEREAPMENTDLRELMRSRMPERKY